MCTFQFTTTRTDTWDHLLTPYYPVVISWANEVLNKSPVNKKSDKAMSNLNKLSLVFTENIWLQGMHHLTALSTLCAGYMGQLSGAMSICQ